MLKAEHKKWARSLFNFYIDRLLKKNFTNFYAANEPPEIPSDKGLIITPNHISWWDGFFIDYVFRKQLNRKIHLMMLEEQLNRYWFFRKVGAYSINPNNSKSIAESIKYTNQLLNDPSNAAVIYPQGEIEAFEKRPLNIKKGLKLFLKNLDNEITVVPIGFKIQFYEEKNPAVISRWGEPLGSDRILDNFLYFEEKFYENLDNLSKLSYKKDFDFDLFGTKS